ncbi:MAG TPA: hypothetical protein VF103_14615 [Polyangiaceae bacterium]
MRHRRPPRKAWFSAWLRAVAAFATLLIAGDHALASLHQALTAHEVCPEHGELVHTGSVRLRVATHDAGPSVQGAEVEAEHHHCGTVPASPTRAPTVSASSELAVAPLADEPTSASLPAPMPATDVLAFAPKQSPPA